MKLPRVDLLWLDAKAQLQVLVVPAGVERAVVRGEDAADVRSFEACRGASHVRVRHAW